MEWLKVPVHKLDASAREQAMARQQILTKPMGALGRLETVAIELAAMQATARPEISAIQITLFAADHGIAEENVSAFPQAVTAEMIRNFSRGGAAICVLARELKADLEVINLGTVQSLEALDNVTDCTLAAGTKNFLHQAAMDEQQLAQALKIGRQTAERVKADGKHLFIGGEMGIGNTSSATGLATALLDMPVTQLVGAGTGLDQEAVLHKQDVIQRALDFHAQRLDTPLNILQTLGGFEIAALVGAYIRCAQLGIPVLLDGFISTSAALLAERILPGVKNWLLFSHHSVEPGHRLILDAMGAQALLSLHMRLGEGSGAAVAVSLLRLACVLHNEMATFEEASVSAKITDSA